MRRHRRHARSRALALAQPPAEPKKSHHLLGWVAFGSAAALAVWGAKNGAAMKAQQAAAGIPPSTRPVSEDLSNIWGDMTLSGMVFGVPVAAIGALVGAIFAPNGEHAKGALKGALVGGAGTFLAPIPYDLGMWVIAGDLPPTQLP
jgi:hypothetical protein